MARTHVAYMKFGEAICKGLGLEASHVKSLTLKIGVGEVPIVEAEIFVDTDKLGVPDLELQRFELIPIEDGY